MFRSRVAITVGPATARSEHKSFTARVRMTQERRMSASSSSSLSSDILGLAGDWRLAGKGVALATVVTTWGSSPRPVGSQLVVDEAGRFAGSVSGGCIEGAVITEALDAIRTGRPRLLDFGVSNEQAWAVGLACGGKVQVFVERHDP